MAITIQTERELRKYLFETFLKEQNNAKKLVLLETPTTPQTNKSSDSEDEENILKDIPPTVARRQEEIKVALQKAKEESGGSTTWDNIMGILSSMAGDTPISFSRYPTTLNEEYLNSLEEIRSKKIADGSISSVIEDLPLPPSAMSADPKDLMLVNVMFKCSPERAPFDVSEHIQPNEYNKLIEFNKTSLSKLYSNGKDIYLAIPIYINKDNDKKPAFSKKEDEKNPTQTIRLGELDLKNLQMSGDSYQFKNAILQDDIEIKKIHNWRYLSFYNTLISVNSNPILNWSLDAPKWDEKTSRKLHGNYPEQYDKYETELAEWNKKYQAALKKYNGIPMQVKGVSYKKIEDLKFLDEKPQEPKKPELNSIQYLDKQYHEDVAINIEKGRHMLLYGRNRDEGINWTPVGMTQNFLSRIEKWRQDASIEHFMESFDNRCQILSNEFRDNYYAVSTEMFTAQLEEIRSQLMTADLKTASGITVSDASVPLFNENIFKKLESKDTGELFTHADMAATLQDYLGNTYDEFELQQFVQLLQLKRTQNTAIKDNLKYSSEYSLLPEYRNLDLDDKSDPRVNDLETAVINVLKNIYEKNLIDISVETYKNLPNNYPGIPQTFYARTAWKNEVPETSILGGYENTDYLDYIISWDTGKSAFTYFFAPISGKENLEKYKGKGKTDLANETVGSVGIQSAADLAQIALIPAQLSIEFTVPATIASMAISFGSWLNRGGYINFIENKTEEIENAIRAGDIESIDGIINDLRKNYIKINNIDDQNITNDQKLLILDKLLKRMSFVETMEQMMWALDMIGWLPGAITYGKAFILNRASSYQRIARQLGNVTAHQIKTPTGRFVNKKTGQVYKTAGEVKKANVSDDMIEEEFALENVNIDPKEFNNTTGYAPTPGSKFKQHVIGAVDHAIETIYKTLFVPLRNIDGERFYTIIDDAGIDITLKNGDTITQEEFDIIKQTQPEQNQFFTKIKDTKNYRFEADNLTDEMTINFKKNTKISAERYNDLKSKIGTTLEGAPKTQALDAFQAKFKASISFDEFARILSKINEEQTGLGKNSLIYENLLDFDEIYPLIKKAADDAGQSIDYNTFKRLYCKIYGINENLLPNNKEIFDVLQKIDLDESQNQGLKNISIKGFLKNMLQLEELTEADKIGLQQLQKYIKLANMNENTDAFKILSMLKNSKTPEGLNIVYGFRLSKNFKNTQSYKVPLKEDYASTYEIIGEIPVKDHGFLKNIVFGPKRFSQYQRVRKQGQVGFKISAEEYEALKKELIDKSEYGFLTQEEMSKFVEYRAPKIKGGFNAYKRQMKLFITAFNDSTVSEMDYLFAEVLNLEFGNTKLFANFDEKKFGQRISELHQINDLMKTGLLNLDEKSLTTILAGLKDWMIDYEKFFNYLLLARYSEVENVDMFAVYNDYLRSGAKGLKPNPGGNKVSTFDYLRQTFKDLKERLKTNLKGKKLGIDGNEEKLAGKSIGFDNQTLVNKGAVTVEELDNARTFFTEISTNYPNVLLRFKKGLEQWNKSFEALITDLKQYQSGNEMLSIPAVQREQLNEFISHLQDLQKRLNLANQEITNSSFFNPKVFNFNNKPFNFLYQTFHLSRIQNGSFIDLRQWFENFSQVGKEGISHFLRLCERLALRPIPLFNEVFELCNQMWKAGVAVSKSDSVKGFWNNILAWQKVVRQNITKAEQILADFSKTLTHKYDFPVASQFFKFGYVCAEGIVSLFKLSLVIGVELVLKHPLFAITMTQYITRAVMLNDLRTAQEISDNFNFNNRYMYPLLVSSLARLKGNIMTSGKGDLLEQFKAFGNNQLMPHFTRQVQLLNTLTYAHKKNGLIAKSITNKEKFNNNIADITAKDNSGNIIPRKNLLTDKKKDYKALEEIFTQFQDNNIILKNHMSTEFKNLLGAYPSVIVTINRNNEQKQVVEDIILGETPYVDENDNEKTKQYIRKGRNAQNQINLNDISDDSIKNEFKAAKLEDLHELIYDVTTKKLNTNLETIIDNYNKSKNQTSKNNHNYRFSQKGYNNLRELDQNKFKNDFIDAILKQKDLNESISRKMFKMDVWVKDADDKDKYIQSDSGLLDEYNLLSEKLKNTFYFYVSDMLKLKNSPKGTVGHYWKRIIERNSASPKIVNADLFNKLSFLDFHNTLKGQPEFKDLKLKNLNLIIGLLKNYLKTATSTAIKDIKEGDTRNPFVNFNDNIRTITVDANLIKAIFDQIMPTVMGSVNNTTSAITKSASWAISWLNYFLCWFMGQKTLGDLAEVYNDSAEAVADAFIQALQMFVGSYHTLYKYFLDSSAIYDTFASKNFSNYDRVDHFITFLEGVALLKQCRNVQSMLNEFANVTGISDIQDDESFKIQTIGKSKRKIIRDHQLDVFSMLTGGIHSIDYAASTSTDEKTKQTQIDLTNVDIVVNPIYINMPNNSSYLEIIDGTDTNPLDTLFDKGLRDLAFAYSDKNAENTPLYIPIGPAFQSISEIPSFENIVNETRKSITEIGNSIDSLINDDDKLLDIGAPKLSETIKELDATEKAKGGATNSPLQMRLEGKNFTSKKFLNKNIFKIEEPLKILFEDVTQAKNNSIISKMINNDSQVKLKQDNIKKNNEMFKAYIKNLQNDVNFNNIMKVKSIDQLDLNNIKNPELQNEKNLFEIRDSLNLDVNYKISDVINNPNLLDNISTSLNMTLDMLQKYNFNDEIASGLKILLTKYSKALPVAISKLKKVNEGIKKGNLKIAKDLDMQSEFDKILDMGIVKYAFENMKYSYAEKNSTLLRKKINQKIAASTNIDLSNQDVYKFLNDNGKNANSKTVISFKLKRVLYIISKFLVPMVKKINTATQSKQRIDFKALLNDYLDQIRNTYKDSVDDEREEGDEYIKFLRRSLILSGNMSTDKILDYSYIIGYQQNVKTKNIDKLIILSDLSNLKNDEKDDIDFINNFIFDIPYIYQIDLTKIMEQNKNIKFVPESFDMENIKIQLVENVMDEDKINDSSEMNSALSTQNFINFSVYKFKKDRVELIEMLKENNIFLENYTQNTIFSL